MEKLMSEFEISDTLLVSCDSTNGVDVAVLIVGRKRPGQEIEIVNAIQGKDAVDLYRKLVTRKNSHNPS